MPDRPAIHQIDEILFFIEAPLKVSFQRGNHTSIVPTDAHTAIFSEINPPLIRIMENDFCARSKQRKPMFNLLHGVFEEVTGIYEKNVDFIWQFALTAPGGEFLCKLDIVALDEEPWLVLPNVRPILDVHTNIPGAREPGDTLENKRAFSVADAKLNNQARLETQGFGKQGWQMIADVGSYSGPA
jgi:hypothetical protein